MKQKDKEKKQKIKDVMDGAVFPAVVNEHDTPLDFMNGPDGLRPGMTKPPSGEITVDLEHGISGRTIPPRSIWVEGQWGADSPQDTGYNQWVVSGEGTPGNHEKRIYRLPESQCSTQVPKHPADWPKYLKDPPKSSWGTGKSSSGSSSSSSSSSSSGLPWGLRVRCPGCGHFFKMDDLATHARSNVCPAQQQGVAMWVIKCECCDNLQESAKVLEGFPIKPPDVSPTASPDTSGDATGDDGGWIVKTDGQETGPFDKDTAISLRDKRISEGKPSEVFQENVVFPHTNLVTPDGKEGNDEAGGSTDPASKAGATT